MDADLKGDAELTGDEGELQGNSEFLPFPKDTVEVVALDAEPTVEEAQPTIAETLTATARAAYATASSLVDAVANDTPPPPVRLSSLCCSVRGRQRSTRAVGGARQDGFCVTLDRTVDL